MSSRALVIISVIVLVVLAFFCGPTGTAQLVKDTVGWLGTFLRNLK